MFWRSGMMNEYIISAWYYQDNKIKQLLRCEIFEGNNHVEAVHKAKIMEIVQRAILDGHDVHYACDMLPRKGEEDD